MQVSSFVLVVAVLLLQCFIGMVFCFFIHKKVIWCNLSAGLFEELDPLEQRVSAGRV